MRALDAFMRAIDALNEKVGLGVSWMTTALVLVVVFDVLTRYVLNISMVAVQELEWHIFSAIFLLGAAFTLKHDEHVRVDVIYSTRSPRVKAWINLLGCLLCLIPFCALVIWASLDFVQGSFDLGEGSENPGGLPARYVLKACIPVGFVLLLLQGVAEALRSVLTLAGRLPEVVEAAPGSTGEA